MPVTVTYTDEEWQAMQAVMRLATPIVMAALDETSKLPDIGLLKVHDAAEVLEGRRSVRLALDLPHKWNDLCMKMKDAAGPVEEVKQEPTLERLQTHVWELTNDAGAEVIIWLTKYREYACQVPGYDAGYGKTLEEAILAAVEKADVVG